MSEQASQRLTMDQVDQSLPFDQWKPHLADYGVTIRRRPHVG